MIVTDGEIKHFLKKLSWSEKEAAMDGLLAREVSGLNSRKKERGSNC